MRRIVTALAVGAALGATLGATLAGGATAADPRVARMSATAIASGLSSPVAITSPRDGSNRLFIVEQPGRIRLFHGGLARTPFLDITDRVSQDGGERGLLGLAFSPNWHNDRHFWVYYTDRSGNNRVSRFTTPVRSNVTSRSTEAAVLTIAHPGESNHNGGQIAFGSDKLLYIGTGDGGGAGDGPGNAQNRKSLLGKMLRIDPFYSSSLGGYSIPSSNPYAAGQNGFRKEIWAFGLRNPWRFSFDAVFGDLYVGDVGQGDLEEIDHAPKGRAAVNYGWDCYEGRNNTFTRYGGAYCSSGTSYQMPLWQYAHTSGRCAIIGGYIYRGSRYKSVIGGDYVYGDYCTGEVFALGAVNGHYHSARVYDFAPSLLTFGVNDGNELFAGATDGKVYSLSAAHV